MIKVREAVEADVLEIKQLLTYTWSDTYGQYLPERIIKKVESTWEDLQQLKNQIEDENVTLTIAENYAHKIIAMITIIDKGDGDFALTRMYVHPNFQGQGVGELILNESLGNLHNVKKLIVDVEERNTRAIKFYKREGFIESIKNKIKIEDVDVEVIHMEKEIHVN